MCLQENSNQRKSVSKENLKLMEVRFSTLRRKYARQNYCKSTNQKQILKATGASNCAICCKKLTFVGFRKYNSFKEIHGTEYFFKG